MNLFTNPSASEFQKLFKKTNNTIAEHAVVVDYDGEVLIDPQVNQPQLDLNKFKVKVHLSEGKLKILYSQPARLQNLFKRIMNDWNKNDFAERSIAF